MTTFFQESDDEYDIHEAAWKNGIIKRQWAETTVVKIRLIDPNTYFGKGGVPGWSAVEWGKVGGVWGCNPFGAKGWVFGSLAVFDPLCCFWLRWIFPPGVVVVCRNILEGGC